MRKRILQMLINAKKRIIGVLTTVTGYPCVLTNSIGVNVVEYKIYGAEGGVGDYDETTGKYLIPIIASVENKNLFDYVYFFESPTIVSYYYNKVFNVTPNTKYTLSTNVPADSGGGCSVFLAQTGGSVTSPRNGASIGSPRTITSTAEGKIYVWLNKSYSSRVIPALEDFEDETWWIQLEEGETATEYEPYVAPITSTLSSDNPVLANDYISDIGNIKTLKGDFAFTAVTTVTPSNLEITYYKEETENDI